MCFRPAAIDKPNICPNCETPNPPTSKKCRECGEPLEHVLADNQDLDGSGAPMVPPTPAPSAPVAPIVPTITQGPQ